LIISAGRDEKGAPAAVCADEYRPLVIDLESLSLSFGRRPMNAVIRKSLSAIFALLGSF